MRNRWRWLALAALVLGLALAGGAAAQETPGAAPPPNPEITGRWVGAKLRCQKDEGKLVRCGTPAAFEIRFAADGSGSTADEAFPKAFTWRWVGAGEVGIIPGGGGEEFKCFAFERDEDALTFQAYVFLPTADPNAPAESRYIHFIFDVNRVE